jgi:hypothetical protein
MKQNKFLLLMLAAILLTPGPAAAWYYAVGGGTGGQADANNFTMAMGKEDIDIRGLTALAGVAIPLILHGSGDIPDSTADSGCPHGNCNSLGEEVEGTEVGLIGSFGLEVFDWSTYVSLLAGVTWADTVELSQSNITGDYYSESGGTEYFPVYGLGISYSPVFFEWKLKMLFSLELDNRRGITGMVGWCW